MNGSPHLVQLVLPLLMTLRRVQSHPSKAPTLIPLWRGSSRSSVLARSLRRNNNMHIATHFLDKASTIQNLFPPKPPSLPPNLNIPITNPSPTSKSLSDEPPISPRHASLDQDDQLSMQESQEDNISNQVIHKDKFMASSSTQTITYPSPFVTSKPKKGILKRGSSNDSQLWTMFYPNILG